MTLTLGPKLRANLLAAARQKPTVEVCGWGFLTHLREDRAMLVEVYNVSPTPDRAFAMSP